jgi:hypothetical protein
MPLIACCSLKPVPLSKNINPFSDKSGYISISEFQDHEMLKQYLPLVYLPLITPLQYLPGSNLPQCKFSDAKSRPEFIKRT